MKPLFDHELAWKNQDIYEEIYANSLQYPAEFWECHKKKLFPENIVNACYNCVDRHLPKLFDKPAIVWLGDTPGERRVWTYGALYNSVQNIASFLLQNGVETGDTVIIYATTSPESVAAILACARIGARHNVVFAGFSPTVLIERALASQSRIILSSKKGNRGGKKLNIAEKAQEALKNIPNSKLFFLEDIPNGSGVPCSNVPADHELFVLYTSGSTGKPKPITHKTFEYLLYTSLSFKYIFDIQPNDIYFCTSDIGWITGHSYMVYAPLFHGITIVLFEGSPTYPTASRYWEIIEQEKVSIFYTAPTAIRSLSMFDDSFVTNHDLSSLRILGSVGEPINIDAWYWYFNVVGRGKCPIADTWWQTETGGIVIAPLLDLSKQKPGYASKPFFGVKVAISPEGELSLLGSCNFEHIASGDKGVIDDDGDIKILGRLDDVINVSGHRLGAIEIENVVNSVPGVLECAVVGIPHEIKGQSIFVFVVKNSLAREDELARNIVTKIKEQISSIATPTDIAFVPSLPKNTSGKIRRHLLKKTFVKVNYRNVY